MKNDPVNNEEHIQIIKEGLFISIGGRKYHIRGIEHTNQRLKVNVKAQTDKRFHIDSIDLYISKQRKVFAKESALLFNIDTETAEADLNRIIEKTETYITSKKDNDTERECVVSDKDREYALTFLKSPTLMKDIIKDFEILGCAGEDTNKMMGYLAAISRKLDDPLSLLILLKIMYRNL